MSAKLELLKKRQDEIEAFFNAAKAEKAKSVTGANLRKWIVNSVTHFSDIGVSTQIISLFLESCEFGRDETGRVSHGVFRFKMLRRGYVLEYEGDSGEHNPYIIPVQVALSVSRLLVEKYEDEERIIPFSLIKIFDSEKHQHIKLALEGVEANYQTKDAVGMMAPLISATENICRLLPELKDEDNVSKCLKRLHEEKSLYERYDVNREIVWSLNSARLIRNEKVVHPKSEHDGAITMHEAVGYAHLLVLFIDSLFSSGEIRL